MEDGRICFGPKGLVREARSILNTATAQDGIKRRYRKWYLQILHNGNVRLAAEYDRGKGNGQVGVEFGLL